MTATFRLLSLKRLPVSFQSIATRSGDFSHGLVSTTVFMNTLTPSRLVESGPIVPRMASAPAIGADHPRTGSRPEVGLKPKTPLLAAGERMEPPISVPIPRTDPLKPTRAPSPPEEPPAVSDWLKGLAVTLQPQSATRSPSDMTCTRSYSQEKTTDPYRLLLVSRCMIVCGCVVRAWNTAPASQSICNNSASSFATRPTHDTKPAF